MKFGYISKAYSTQRRKDAKKYRVENGWLVKTEACKAAICIAQGVSPGYDVRHKAEPCMGGIWFKIFSILVIFFSFAYADDEVLLPEGPDEAYEESQSAKESPFDDFLEVRVGMRIQNDPFEKDFSLGEFRFQRAFAKDFEKFSLDIAFDVLFDFVLESYKINFHRGSGIFDLRRASVTFTPLSFLDVTVGRQALTWGTGDLVFINDLFSKDWQSFLIGRDIEYLKAPSDSVKLSFFTDYLDIDFIYSARFNADRFINGERLSYWNKVYEEVAGRNRIVREIRRKKWLRDDEFFLRLSKNVEGYELALYGYYGYWKSPGGINLDIGKVIFPKLSVYGASARGQIFGGIGNVEVGYYDSRQNRGGSKPNPHNKFGDPCIRNSQWRFLLGYSRDLSFIKDFSFALQYYLEHTLHHETLPMIVKRLTEKNRHVLTLRLTKMLLNQNLTLSLFTFYSPTDKDCYLRPRATYKINDNWTSELGANLFFGKHSYTFFGQFKKDTNVYISTRCSY